MFIRFALSVYNLNIYDFSDMRISIEHHLIVILTET